jgi:hypothetical protein
VKRPAALVLAAWLAGCSCDGAPPTSAAPEPTEVAPVLPTATRADLPAAVPAITITIGPRSFVVSNAALVASWPEVEREAVGRTRPLGDAAYPVVERTVDDGSDDPLHVIGLREAVTAVVAVEHARSAIVHAEGITGAFAIRAEPDVHFGRVLAALYAAGSLGLVEPRYVLASPSGERELRLTLSDEREIDPAVAAAVATAMAALTGTAVPDVDAGIAPPPPRASIVWVDGGLDVRRGDTRYAAGCGAEATSDAPTIPTSAITPAAIAACLDAIAARTVVIRATRETRYADVIAVIEPIAATHPVELALP